MREPETSDVQSAKVGMSEFIRVEFKMWPGQGGLVETTFRQRLLTALKQFDPNYADWMVVVTYRATELAGATVSI